MQNARPTFLTVLCILTFIASAWGLYSAYSGYASADLTAAVKQGVIEDVQDKIDEASANTDEAGAKAIDKMMDSVAGALDPEKIKTNSIYAGISSLLTLLGAILMWGLNKKGYFIYVAGVLVSIAGPIIAYGGGFVGLMAAGFSIFFGVLFSILYFLNIKHMA
jgi:hypothetical protein